MSDSVFDDDEFLRILAEAGVEIEPTALDLTDEIVSQTTHRWLEEIKAQEDADKRKADPLNLDGKSIDGVIGEESSVESVDVNSSVENQQPIEEIDFEFESEKLLRSLNVDLERVREEWAVENDKFSQMRIDRDNMQRALDDLNRKLREQELLREQVSRQGKQLKDDVARAEHQLTLEREIKQKEQALADRLSTFELRTADMPWRTGKKIVSTRVNKNGFIEVPVIMKHQDIGSDQMAAAERGLISDGMGLGKSLTCVATVSKLDEGQIDPETGEHITGGRKPALNVLFVGPGEGMTDMANTVKMWSYYKPVVIGRQPKASQQAMLEQIRENKLQGVFVIVNYESWARNKSLLSWINNTGFDMVVVDEAHHMKNVSTSVYKGVADVVFTYNRCTTCNEIVQSTDDWICRNGCKRPGTQGSVVIEAEKVPSVKYFLAMTGTFILNRPQEMFASLHLAYPEIFQTIKEFQWTFCDWSGERWAPGGQARLAQKISGFYIRRTREDAGVVLPKSTTYIHEIEIEEEDFPLQYEILDDLRKRATIQIKETEERTGEEFPQFNMLALITRQRQATVWPGGIYINEPCVDDAGWPVLDDEGNQLMERIHVGQHFQQSAKIDMAMELVDELREDSHVILVVSQFLEALDVVKHRCELRGLRVGELTGPASIRHREDVKYNLNRVNGETSRYDVVVMHYKTGGEALNLTAATAMIVLDEEWNEGKHDQATGRLDRTGQTEETQVHILRHTGPQESIDTWLKKLIDRKRDVVQGFNNSVKDLKTAFGL